MKFATEFVLAPLSLHPKNAGCAASESTGITRLAQYGYVGPVKLLGRNSLETQPSYSPLHFEDEEPLTFSRSSLHGELLVWSIPVKLCAVELM